MIECTDETLTKSIPERNLEDVRTGDCLFFSSFACNSMLVRMFTSSPWNHVGVAVRVLPDGSISVGPEGKLCVLESGAHPRRDVLNGSDIIGVATIKFEEIAREYILASVRHIRRSLLTPEYSVLVADFIRNYSRLNFAGAQPFLAVWLGLPTERGGSDFFCSELAAHFYQTCAYPILLEQIRDFREEKIDISPARETKSVWDEDIVTGDRKDSAISSVKMPLNEMGRLTQMFGQDSPHLAQLFSPQVLSKDGTPESLILSKEQPTIWRREDDARAVITQHVVVVIGAFFLGLMILRAK